MSNREWYLAIGGLVLVAVVTIALTTTSSGDKPKEGDKDKEGEKDKVVKTESGLEYVDLKVGEGAAAKKGDQVSVYYRGTLKENGTEFDKRVSGQPPFEFVLGEGEVIQGWDEGVAGMKVGGKRKLTIPAKLAYGPRARPGIPANSDLVFEVELVKVK